MRRLELPASSSQRGLNLVLHVHELHLALFSPENLLSGALFMWAYSNAPVDSRCFAAIPGSVVISQLSFIPNLILSSFFLNLVSMEITSSAVSVFGMICRIENWKL